MILIARFLCETEDDGSIFSRGFADWRHKQQLLDDLSPLTGSFIEASITSLRHKYPARPSRQCMTGQVAILIHRTYSDFFMHQLRGVLVLHRISEEPAPPVVRPLSGLETSDKIGDKTYGEDKRLLIDVMTFCFTITQALSPKL